MSLTLRDKSKTKFKNGVVVALSIFALVAQPVYTVVDSAVANAVAGKTIQAGTYFADDSDCDRNVVTPKCTTIGAAVAAAQDGDIVLLRSNFSPASEILVNKNITIDGNGRTVWGEFNTNGSNNSIFELSAPATIQNVNLRGKNHSIHGINAWHTNGDATVWGVTLENFGKSGLNVGEQARVVAGNLTTSGNGWHAIDVDKTGSWLKLGGINSFNENPKVPVIYVDDVNVGTIGVIDSPNLYGHIDNTGHLLDAVNYRTGDRAYFLALDAPELVAPSNNSSVKGASLTNSWTAVSGADHYVYESYNDDDASANSLRWRESFTSTSKTATNVANATFWWRVKAVNSFGLESSWSSLYKVTVDNTAPSVPTFTMYDADGNVITSDITTKDFKFVLNSSSDVVRYQLRYTNDIAGAAVSSWSPNDISATGHMATLGEYIDNFTQGEGVHHFSFSACDAAGNCSAFSTPFTVNYSKTAPAVANPETPVTPNPPANNQDNSGQAGANNGGQQGASTGAVANGFTNVTVDGQTAADNTDNTGDSVLGEQDNKTAEKISTYDDGETTPEVKGASDEKGCTKFLGICWYYWIPIVIVVVVLGRWLYGTLRRRGEGNA